MQHSMERPRVSYAAKLITAGVAVKALLMGILVSVLAVAGTFWDSIILVLVSATATGVFGLLIVLVQTRAGAEMHSRLDRLEEKATTAAEASTAAATKTQTIVDAVTDPSNPEHT